MKNITLFLFLVLLSNVLIAQTTKSGKTTTKKHTTAAQRKQQEEARQKAEEAYRQQQAEIERQKAEQAARDKFKNRIPSGSGSGVTRGGTGVIYGNQGSVDDLAVHHFTGRFEGLGNTDGFGSRKTTNIPKCEDYVAAEGIVIIEAVIDKQGNVVSTRLYPQGTTTSDPILIAKARDCAADYKFEAGTTDRVKGRIKFTFKNR